MHEFTPYLVNRNVTMGLYSMMAERLSAWDLMFGHARTEFYFALAIACGVMAIAVIRDKRREKLRKQTAHRIISSAYGYLREQMGERAATDATQLLCILIDRFSTPELIEKLLQIVSRPDMAQTPDGGRQIVCAVIDDFVAPSKETGKNRYNLFKLSQDGRDCFHDICRTLREDDKVLGPKR